MEHTGLTARKREQHKYYVVANYLGADSNDDKKYQRVDNEEADQVYRAEVYADSLVHAISRGMEIINHARAEIMCDYITSHPIYGQQDTYTREELDNIYEEACRIGLFQHWLAVQPTSIQANRVDDEDILIDMTVNSVYHEVSHISDEVEDFLKEQDDDA